MKIICGRDMFFPRRCHWVKHIKGFQPFARNRNSLFLKGKYIIAQWQRLGKKNKKKNRPERAAYNKPNGNVLEF